MIAGATGAQADPCCYLDAIAAPFVAAGAIVEGAVAASAAIVTAPFTALTCGACGVAPCNTCSSPKAALGPGDYGRY
jgi:hypothetical protein